MSGAARRLTEDRALRDAARSVFNQRLELVKAELADRGIGERIADRIVDEAKSVAEQAVEVADANRGIVVGTLAALLLWVFRGPLSAWISSIGDKEEALETVEPVGQTKEPLSLWQRFRNWIAKEDAE
jgi:hypothetical protein